MTSSLLSPHIWFNLRVSSYIMKPFLIYDFASDPIWISVYMRIFFLFYQCNYLTLKEKKWCNLLPMVSETKYGCSSIFKKNFLSKFFCFLGCEDKCKEQSQLCDPSTMECYGIQLFSYKVSTVLQIKFLWIIFKYIGVF